MNGDSDLGRIERVEPRRVWPHEAANFTPWLADHIDELGLALGMDLELQSTEAPVGPFSLDLLARDIGASRTVIVENQLEQTDHEHLGKSLTYAGGFDADVIIWIASQFNDQHRQALDWLNQRTGDDTECFGVVIEVWKIDDGRPAPHFNIVAAPNEWRRDIRKARPSERNLRYKAFFQQLLDTLRETGFTNARKAQPQSWYLFSAGPGRRVGYSACFGQGNVARVEVYINREDRESNKKLFDQLRERREAIESDLATSLSWQRLDRKKASRIAMERPGSIDEEPETLDEILAWMKAGLLTFDRVFGPRLDEIAAESD